MAPVLVEYFIDCLKSGVEALLDGKDGVGYADDTRSRLHAFLECMNVMSVHLYPNQTFGLDSIYGLDSLGCENWENRPDVFRRLPLIHVMLND